MNAARYKILESYVADSVYILDYEWNHVYVNKAAVDFVKIPRENLLGHKLMDLFPGIEKTPFFKAFQEVMDTRTPGSVINKYIFPDGRKGWYEVNIYPVSEGILCISRDITNQKNLEELITIQRDLAIQVSQVDSLIEALKLALHTILDNTDLDCGGIYLVEAESGELNMLYHKGLSDPFIQATSHYGVDGPHIELLEQGKTLYLNYEKLNLPKTDAERREGLKIIIIVPILHQNRVLGCINVSTHSLNEIPIESRKIIESIGSLVGQSIQRFRLSATLKKSEEKYRQLLETVSDAIISIDHEFRILSWNKAAEQIYGWRAEEVLGKRMADVIPPEYHPDTNNEQVIQEFLANGSWKGEVVQTHKDGIAIQVLASVSALRDQNGELTGAVTINHDITDRKRAEQKLKYSEEQLRKVFETMVEGVVLVTPKGHILQANAAAERILGLRWSEIEKYHYTRDNWDIIRPDGTIMPSEEKAGPRAIGTKRLVQNVVMGVKRSDGTISWINDSAAPILDSNGEVELVVGTFVDITEQKMAEQKLKDSEAKYRSFIQNFKGIAYQADMEMHLFFLHGLIKEITGYEVDEFLSGKISMPQILHPDDFQTLIKGENFKSLRTKPNYSTESEYRIIRKDGQIRWVKDRNSNVCDEAGTPIKVQGTLFDITERKRVEQALAASEKKFRMLTEKAVVGIYIIQDAKMVYVNPSLARTLGYDPEEIINKLSMKDMIHPDDIEIAIRRFQERLEGALEKANRTYRAIRKDGATILIETHNILIEYQGKPAVMGTMIDITERKQAEQLLKESEEKYRAVFDNSPVGIGMATIDGKIITLNENMARIFGYTMDEAQDIKLQSIYVDPKRRTQLIDLVQEFGSVKDFESQLRRKNGEKYDALLNVNLLELGGEKMILTCIRDVTEQKSYMIRLEEDVNQKTQELQKEAKELQNTLKNLKETQDQLIQSEKLASIGLLAAGVAHEINNPLMGVINYAQIVKDHLGNTENIDLASKPYSFLNNIIKEGDRIAEIVHGLLTFALEDTGKYVNAAVAEMINSALILLLPKMKSNLIDLQTFYNKDLPKVPVRESNIQQVILNVLQNSIDAVNEKFGEMSSQGEKKITIKTSIVRKQKKRYVQIRIHDNGQGIQKETLQKIFDPFFTTKTKGKDSGVGLGLSVSYGIIKEHGGDVFVRSKRKKYTEVDILLPLER